MSKKLAIGVITVLIASLYAFSVTWAQNAANNESVSPPPIIELDELLITPSVFNFDFSPDTSSRLDLPAFETPASITVISNAELKGGGGVRRWGKLSSDLPGSFWETLLQSLPIIPCVVLPPTRS